MISLLDQAKTSERDNGSQTSREEECLYLRSLVTLQKLNNRRAKRIVFFVCFIRVNYRFFLYSFQTDEEQNKSTKREDWTRLNNNH